jgi:hypothetical protein
MKKNEPEQTTLNELIEKETGQPPEPGTLPVTVDQPARRRTKEGFHGLFVSVSDEHFAELEKTADGRPLNVWLSRLVDRNFSKLQ